MSGATVILPSHLSRFRHDNALRIFGPAGAGKTRELVRILQEHVADGDFTLPEGIIVSFTRAAAHDIARRVNPDGTPGRYHCTLHALCKRYYGFDSDIAEPRLKEFFGARKIPYGGRVAADPEEWLPSADAEKSEGSLLIAFFALCRNRLLSIPEGKQIIRPEKEVEQWWIGNRLERLWQEYVDWKDAEGLVDFTDMLEFALRHPPRTTWPFFVLDEAQDCTPLQWAVAQVFAACAEVVYIAGDDDQAIYTWAGATPEEFLGASVRLDDVLHLNHRSGANLVDAAQKFIRQNQRRREKGMRAAKDGGVIEWTMDVPALSPNESTQVMARAHYLNEPIMQELTDLEFPFVDKRGKYGVTGKAAPAYLRYLRLTKGQAITVREWRLLTEAIPSDGPWLVRGSKTRLRSMAKEIQENTYARAGDLLHYGATEELVNAIRAGADSPLKRLDAERVAYLKGVARRYGEKMLDERTAGVVCSVGPIHSFKGLEADTVVLHGGMPPAATREAFHDPEPERRVFYVAMTRARSRLIHYDGSAFARWREVL